VVYRNIQELRVDTAPRAGIVSPWSGLQLKKERNVQEGSLLLMMCAEMYSAECLGYREREGCRLGRVFTVKNLVQNGLQVFIEPALDLHNR
jgi:hypothetical protein